jgi:AcrR family transcriptional regulator
MTSAAAAPTDALPDTAQRIVLAAEREFAERGFDGAGMKAISQRAEVSQALLHYHFGNKDHLYSEVIRRRSKLINEERETLLGAVDLGGPGAVAGILDALFRPPLGPAGGDQAYTRIFGGLVVGRERERALVKEYYDPTAKKFIAALQEALGTEREVAALCYTLSLGALVVVIARDGRVERLMGREAVQGMEEMLAHLITYASGGIAALTGGAPG